MPLSFACSGHNQPQYADSMFGQVTSYPGWSLLAHSACDYSSMLASPQLFSSLVCGKTMFSQVSSNVHLMATMHLQHLLHQLTLVKCTQECLV